RCERAGAYGISDPSEQSCGSAWQFSLTIPAELQKPGTYQLSSFPVGYEQSITSAGGESGCGHCAASGGGTSGTTGGGPPGAGTGPRGAVLEIYSVTDLCITGRVQGLESGQISPPPPSFNGAFHAVRCVQPR